MIIEISKNDLIKLVGKEMSNGEIEDLLFNLKCEAEFVADNVSVEINPDRLDMVSVEGIARAMKAYLGLPAKELKIEDSKFTINGESEVRPIFLAAIVEGVEMTDELVKSLMQIQEKLHGSVGRDRKKVAIGVHDLDTIQGLAIEYHDVDDITFVPLQETREMNIKQILNEHPKGKTYAHLLNDSYPVFTDKEGVLSFPPIINSDRTKVTSKTKNLFIDVTGTDRKAVEQCLNIILTNIVERKGVIKTVKVNKEKFPKLNPSSIIITKEEINNLLGLELDETQIKSYLEKMLYTVKAKGGRITVSIPPYRSDILHPVDIIEDVAIGYGYDKFVPTVPKLATIGNLSEKEVFTRKVRETMIGFGFNEFLNFVLSSKENNFDNMLTGGEAVELVNPVSSEYSVCRTWITPSLVKVLSHNLHNEYPQKIFEVGDIVLFDNSKETKTRTVRCLAGAISHDNANLTEIKSIVEGVLNEIGIKFDIKSINHPSFIPTRCGEIFVNTKSIGFFGELHPRVLEKWGLERSVISFEINLEGLYG
ncbi:MAG: phenylalanine--tRNA ligase subunit beta [Nanoarchaeota archaeon]|nr:phenylalanine--tRNA ligase subunit beta [Nanoarchaeota archaeon]